MKPVEKKDVPGPELQSEVQASSLGNIKCPVVDLFTTNAVSALLTEFPENSPPKLNSFGQRLVSLPENVRMFSRYHLLDVIDSNKDFQFEGNQEAADQMLSARSMGFGVKQLTSHIRHGLTGCRIGIDDKTILPAYGGFPLEATELAILALPLRKGEKDPPSSLGAYMPLKSHPDCQTLPLLGGIYINNRQLTDSELDKLNFAQVARTVDGKTELCNAIILLQGGRSGIIPGFVQFVAVANKEGGFEIVESKKQAEELTARGVKLEGRAAVGTQYIGLGLRRYVAHLVNVSPEGKVDCRADDLVVTNGVPAHEKTVTFVQRPAYVGHSGIFLDVLHQPYANSPSGGLVSAEVEAQRDRLLLAKGAKVSGITLGSYTLFTKEELAEVIGVEEASTMVCPKLAIAIRLIVDDTRRLDNLTAGHENSENDGPNAVAFSIVEEISEKKGKEAIEWYLTDLATTLGKNLRIVLENKLTMPKDQKACSNLSVRGGIIDSENFVPMTGRLQCYGLVKGWTQALLDTAEALGIKSTEFVKTRMFSTFFSQFTGLAYSEAARHNCEININGLGIYHGPSTFVSSVWIARSLSAENRCFNFKELAESLTHPLVIKTADLQPGALLRIKELLLSSRPYTVIEFGTGAAKKSIKLSREVALETAHTLYIAAALREEAFELVKSERSGLPPLKVSEEFRSPSKMPSRNETQSIRF